MPETHNHPGMWIDSSTGTVVDCQQARRYIRGIRLRSINSPFRRLCSRTVVLLHYQCYTPSDSISFSNPSRLDSLPPFPPANKAVYLPNWIWQTKVKTQINAGIAIEMRHADTSRPRKRVSFLPWGKTWSCVMEFIEILVILRCCLIQRCTKERSGVSRINPPQYTIRGGPIVMVLWQSRDLHHSFSQLTVWLTRENWWGCVY